MVGHYSSSEGYVMTPLLNTKLYYVKTTQWDGYLQSAFIDANNKWGSESNSVGSRKLHADHSSDVFHYQELINTSNGYGLFTTNFKDDHSTVLSFSRENSYSILNKSQTITLQSYNLASKTYTNSSTVGSVSFSSIKMSSATSTTNSSQTITNSASADAIYTANVTLTASVNPGYKFDCWSDGNNQLGTNLTYSYSVPSTNKTVYARFSEITYSVQVKSAGNNQGTVSPANVNAGQFTGVTITATPKVGFSFKNWTATAGITIADPNSASTTITATKAGTVTANFEEKFTTIYLEPTGHWNSDNPQYVAHVWIRNNTSVNKGIIMTGVGEAPYKYYKAEVPYGYTDVVFFRNSTDGNTLWNKTGDLTIPTDNNVLYTITSAGKGQTGSYNPAATGEWKEANLVYTITLGSSMFGPYGISHNGQSYYSHKNEDVIVNVPHGATINFIEGQPYSDIYTGDIMEKGKVRKFDLTQPYTVLRDIKFESNYVTKNTQIAYLGVPNNCDWDKNASYANFTWRFDSYDNATMTNRNDRAEYVFEANTVKYYKFTIPAGCNKFQIQRKEPKAGDDESNGTMTDSHTGDHPYMVLNTDINCYMLDEGTYNNSTHPGKWCALPPQSGDYRLLYVEQVVEKDAQGTTITRKKAHPSDVVRANEITAEGAIVSLHTYKYRTYPAITVYDEGGNHTYDQGSFSNPEIILQKYDGSNWVDMESYMVYRQLETAHASMATLPGRKNASPGSSVDDFRIGDGIEAIKNDTHEDQGNGVWNFYIINNGTKVTVDLPRTHRYTGDYYIRTDAAFGGWNSYTGSDNHMTRSDVSKQHSNYSHYYCKWIGEAGVNVKYTIANDYGIAISDTLEADITDIWGEELTQEQKIVRDQTLPAKANVRFSWNEKTNFLHRAYLAGSTNVADRFLVLQGSSEDEISGEDGQPLLEGGNGTKRYGLKANEERFHDISNWVYYADVQMKPKANIKVVADYKWGESPNITHVVQYFVGRENVFSQDILKGTGDKKYLIRLLYDFKTNELISAYVPVGNNENTEIEPIQTNLMLIRTEDYKNSTEVKTLAQLGFRTNNMTDVNQNAYGVLEITKDRLTSSLPYSARTLYWVSFPFDVRVSDVFSSAVYGNHWIIQSYNGAKRAAEGLYLDSDSNWEYHFDPSTINDNNDDPNDNGILKKGVGYVVALNYVNIDRDQLFKTTDAITLYFPSTTSISGHIINNASTTIVVPAHTCNINRPITNGDRRIADSHWNVIGVPAYKNAGINFENDVTTFANVTYYYKWLGERNLYQAVGGKDQNFDPLHSYMVQYHGELNWRSIVNEGPASLAAKRNSDDMKQHHLRLELQQNGTEQDRTFIQLQEEEVTTSFDFNYDLCKIKNGGANIYSLIATDRDPIEVAGNVLPIQETVIPVGVVISAASEYTFAMPEGTDGIVVELIDYETNTRTNLLLDEYTVNLGKGTFENRFALHVKPNKTTTSLEDVSTNTTGVKKYLIDGILYMQKDGALYDAQGKLVR